MLAVTDRPSPFTLDPGEQRAETAAGWNEDSGAFIINLCVCARARESVCFI